MLRRLERLRRVLASCLVALVAATVAFGVTPLLLGPGSVSAPNPAPPAVLLANVNFTITSTVSATTACTSTVLLYSGVQDYLCYDVHNPYEQSMTVTAIRAVTTSSPIGCPVSNLDLRLTTYTGTPPLVVGADGTGVVAEPISLTNNRTNQDACEGVTFHFAYTGTARVTTPPVTPPATLPFTGADIAGMASAGTLALLLGALLILLARRRRRAVSGGES